MIKESDSSEQLNKFDKGDMCKDNKNNKKSKQSYLLDRAEEKTFSPNLQPTSTHLENTEYNTNEIPSPVKTVEQYPSQSHSQKVVRTNEMRQTPDLRDIENKGKKICYDNQTRNCQSNTKSSYSSANPNIEIESEQLHREENNDNAEIINSNLESDTLVCNNCDGDSTVSNYTINNSNIVNVISCN